MVCPPTLRDEVVSWAFPVLSRATGLPTFTLSTRNWTVPVGVVVAGEFGETVAVKVTLSPNTVGLFDVITVIVVAPLVPVTDSFALPHAPDAPALFVSPP